MPRRRMPVAALLVALLVLAGAAASRVSSAAPVSARQGATVQISVPRVLEHLRALQRIATRNNGNRLAGTAGYDASAAYVAQRMRAAGYRVTLQDFAFQLVVDRSPPVLRPAGADPGPYRANQDFATLAYSGSGEAEAPVVAVDLAVPVPGENASTSGCESADFAGFPRGAIALTQRGTCTFRQKVDNARAAGASAVIVFNDGAEGRRGLFRGTLGAPQAALPAVAASFAVGDALRDGVRNGPTGVTVRVRTDMLAQRRTTRNVLAESRTGNARNVVMVGGHLDSVAEGPGINDNGSGSAVLLEIAERLAKTRPQNRLRFAWWGAEELGLLGSRHYVDRLSAAARGRIALYLNADMVGSPNFVRFVYDGDGSASSGNAQAPPAGSAAIERVFRRYFSARKLPVAETALGSASDHAPFARVGIPVGGLFSGASGRKSEEQASVFGGRAGQPFDPCYHERCDTTANVSAIALRQLGNALAHAVERFARSTAGVNGR